MAESIEIISTSCKTDICARLREALAEKGPLPQSNSNIQFDTIENLLDFFRQQFEKSGGKYINFPLDSQRSGDRAYVESVLSEVYRYVKLEIELGKYQTILNVSPCLEKILDRYEIPCVDAIPVGTVADVAIVFAEFLVARTGHIAFSQRNKQMLYPSIFNLAKNIIVISTQQHIVSDLKMLLDRVEEVKKEEHRPDEVCFSFDIMELLRPQHFEEEEQSDASRPHITLVMLEEQ